MSKAIKGGTVMANPISHDEADESTPEWAEKGAHVLFHVVVETAEIAE